MEADLSSSEAQERARLLSTQDSQLTKPSKLRQAFQNGSEKDLQRIIQFMQEMGVGEMLELKYEFKIRNIKSKLGVNPLQLTVLSGQSQVRSRSIANRTFTRQ